MRRTLPLLALTLAGCVQGDGKYPSLLPRAIEAQSVAEPVRADPVATPDAALDARVGELSTALDTGAKSFAAAAQNAEAQIAVARGLPVGSDPWLDAQTALTGLDSVRSPVIVALGELERLAIDRGAAGRPPYPALDTAIARARTLDADQTKRVARLEAALESP